MSRPVKRPHTNHKAVVARLRAHPGIGQEVSAHRARYTATRAAWRVRTAYDAPLYAPAGAFEARVVDWEDDALVVARWLGPQQEAALWQAAALAAVRAGGAPRG